MTKTYIDLDGNRGSGRTTKMLFEAAQETLGLRDPMGKVVIIVHDQRFVAHVVAQLTKLFNPTITDNIKVLAADSHLVKKVGPAQFKCCAALWNTKVVLVDHHVYYRLLEGVNEMLEGFYKYD